MTPAGRRGGERRGGAPFHPLPGVVPAPVAAHAQLLVLVRGDILLPGKWLLFHLNASILNHLFGSF